MIQEREFQFTDHDFNAFRTLVREQTGISLSDVKRDLVYGRISRRLRALSLDSFRQYLDLLEQDGNDELEHFINAITTNLTAFFRENHHFETLAATVLPDLLQRRRSARRLRLWSAGCSTGEEVYSIAMVLRETIPDIRQWDIKILATDLDSAVLSTAKQGIYQQDRIEGLSNQRQQRWFKNGKGANEGLVRVCPELQEIISFRQLNLMDSWPMRGPFDVLFCRNVVIYFDKDTQRKLFSRYGQLLADDGYLFIGHSESLHKVCDRFELLGKTIYKKAA